MTAEQWDGLVQVGMGVVFAVGVLSGLLSWQIVVVAKDHATLWGRWND